LLHLRAKQKTAFDGGPRGLLADWPKCGCCRLVDMTAKGRPHVRWQIAEFDKVRRPLVEALTRATAIG